MIDLSPEHLQLVKTILANHASGCDVWAYGSRVTGKAHAGSDLDLVIFSDDDQHAERCVHRLREAFRESDLPILIDILAWAGLPEAFKQEITQQHVVVYSGRNNG